MSKIAAVFGRSMGGQADYILYFSVAFLVAWGGFHYADSREAVASALTAGLIALKAKRSESRAKEDGSNLQTVP